ncbi:hypothetical protein ACFL2Q_03850 [Thermodesulfobacteriota bacterium]
MQPMQQQGSSLAPAFDTEPMSLGDMLDRSCEIFKNYLWKLVAIMLLPLLLYFVVALFAFMIVGVTAGFSAATVGVDSSWFWISIAVVGGIASLAAILLVMSVAHGALIYAIALMHLGQDVGVMESFRFGLSRVIELFLTFLLAGVIMIGMMVLWGGAAYLLYLLFEMITPSGLWSAVISVPLTLPPTYVMVKLMMIDKVIVVENVAYWKALQRSWNLVSGRTNGPWPKSHWIRFVIVLHIILLIQVTIYLIFSGPPMALVFLLPPPLNVIGSFIGQLTQQVGGVLFGAFGSVYPVIFYYDLRNRKEGLDIEMFARIYAKGVSGLGEIK